MELGKEFVGCLALEFRHEHSPLTERIGGYYAKPTCLSDDGETVSLNPRQREEASHSYEFLTRVASYNSSLTEQFISTLIIKGCRTCMMVCGTCSALRTARLYGCNSTSLSNERLGMTKQFFRVPDALNVQNLSTHIPRRIKALIHILKHILNTSIASVSDTPHGIESETCHLRHLYGIESHTSRVGYQIHSLRTENRIRRGECSAIVGSNQTYAIRTYERTSVFIASSVHLSLENSAIKREFAKARRNNDKRLDTLL